MQQGYSALELMVSIFIVTIVAAFAFTGYRSYLVNAETVDALDTVSVLEEQLLVLATTAPGQLHTCDDLLAHGGLANDYLTQSIVALPSGEAALAVTAKADGPGGSQGVAVAAALHEELLGLGKEVQTDVVGDALVSFRVRLTPSGRAFCSGTTQQVATAAPVTTTTQSNQPASGSAQPSGNHDPMTSPLPPAITKTAPSAPATADDIPSCPTGQEFVTVIEQGVAVQTCLTQCADDEILKADGACHVLANPPPPAMCVPFCADVYMGDCTQDFPGLCGEALVQQICGVTCGTCDSTPVECSTIKKIGHDPGPTLPSHSVKFLGSLPSRHNTETTLTVDDIVKGMAATGGNIDVTAIRFHRSGMTARKDAAGWHFSVQSGWAASAAFVATVTLDNGQGTTDVQVVMSAW